MIRVQQDDFDPGAELEQLRGRLQGRVGAMVSFIGLVRDLNEGDTITGMTLEHYPGMTEKAADVHGREPTATSCVSTHLIPEPIPPSPTS